MFDCFYLEELKVFYFWIPNLCFCSFSQVYLLTARFSLPMYWQATRVDPVYVPHGSRLIPFLIGLQMLLISFMQSSLRFFNNVAHVSSLSANSAPMTKVPLLLHFFISFFSRLHIVEPQTTLCDVKDGNSLIPLTGRWTELQPEGRDNFQTCGKSTEGKG